MSKYKIKLTKTSVTLAPTAQRLLANVIIKLLVEKKVNRLDLLTRILSRTTLGWDAVSVVGARTIDRLEKDGYIAVGYDKKYCLTAAGLKLAEKVTV